jgi:hypothetical protein
MMADLTLAPLIRQQLSALPRHIIVSTGHRLIGDLEARGQSAPEELWAIVRAFEGPPDSMARVVQSDDDEIRELYRLIRAATDEPNMEEQSREWFARLRELEDREVRRMSEYFERHRVFDPKKAADTLARADALLAEHEGPSSEH